VPGTTEKLAPYAEAPGSRQSFEQVAALCSGSAP
jgi:hypothetical protein